MIYPANDWRQEKGFTLLEVLVATAIVGIGLGVALAAISHARGQVWRGEQIREAAMLLRQAAYDLLEDRFDGGEKPNTPPGWSVAAREEDGANVTLMDENGTAIPVDPSGLRTVTIEALSPSGQRFVLNWIDGGAGKR